MGEDRRATEVLEYWFGPAGTPPASKMGLWFGKDAALDAEIVARFGGAIVEGGAGRLEGWARTPRGRLALIVLLDQMSRNAFRGTPRMFTQDPVALRHAKACVAAGEDKGFSFVERAFVYLPYEHSEELSVQEECVALYKGLLADAAPEERSMGESFLLYAERHHEIIARFGRFPHRNEILGRATTAEEAAFLKEPMSSF